MAHGIRLDYFADASAPARRVAERHENRKHLAWRGGAFSLAVPKAGPVNPSWPEPNAKRP